MKWMTRSLVLGVLTALLTVAPAFPGDGPAGKKSAILALRGQYPGAIVGGKEVAGDPAREKAPGGFRYRFASVANEAAFAAHPDKYAIQLRGQCVAMPSAAGNPELFTVYQGRIYLGGTPECL